MKQASFLCILLAALPGEIQSNDVEWGGDDDDRLQLWSRGEFDLDEGMNWFSLPFRRLGPISRVRNAVLRHQRSPNCDSNGYCWNQMRGGSQSPVDYNEAMDIKIQELSTRLGADFLAAIEQNKRDHEEDCRRSCEMYYCADKNAPLIAMDDILGPTTIKSYSMGPVPPEDFVSAESIQASFFEICWSPMLKSPFVSDFPIMPCRLIVSGKNTTVGFVA